MRLTKKNSPKSYTIYYLPQEIKETMVTEVSYLPITRERLEQFFKSNGMKHLKINKNLYICIVNLMLTNC